MLFKCTICGQVGTVARCCGLDTRIPLNDHQLINAETSNRQIQDMKFLKFFNYGHLPSHLQVISKPFHDLAHETFKSLPPSEERQVCLRKLLEAKDCAVRAFLSKDD